MPIISAQQAKREYDVVIVGSGAAGGQSAYTLTLAGLKCVMLEAGRAYDPANETPMWNVPRQAPLMATSTPDKPFGFYDATVGGGWDVPGEPYTSVQDSPREKFTWWRPRMLGGRTNHWGRISLRNGPYDFKPRSRDGLGFDWPIGYEDVEPYYTKGWRTRPTRRRACCFPRPRRGRPSYSRRSMGRGSGSRSSPPTVPC
jgi:choline dehydrogenase-like flavoprotein